MGIKAMKTGKVADGQSLFGAAIRSAKQIGMWDIEAEFFKFVALYQTGDYSAAVQRAVKCLDRVKMFNDIAQVAGVELPKDVMIAEMEDCLAQAMVKRGDSFMALMDHFWSPARGEYYLLKKKTAFIDAVMKAWRTMSISIPIDYDMAKNELKLYTAFLNEVAQNKGKAEEDAEAEKASGISAMKDAAEETNKEMSGDELVYTEFLQGAITKGYMSLSSEDMDILFDACRMTQAHASLVLIAKLINELGPNSKKPFVAALAGNEAMTDEQTVFGFAEAKGLQDEVRDFVSKMNV